MCACLPVCVCLRVCLCVFVPDGVIEFRHQHRHALLALLVLCVRVCVYVPCMYVRVYVCIRVYTCVYLSLCLCVCPPYHGLGQDGEVVGEHAARDPLLDT